MSTNQGDKTMNLSVTTGPSQPRTMQQCVLDSGSSGDDRQSIGTLQTRPRLHLLRQNLLEEVRTQDPHQVINDFFFFSPDQLVR